MLCVTLDMEIVCSFHKMEREWKQSRAKIQRVEKTIMGQRWKANEYQRGREKQKQKIRSQDGAH